MLVCSLEDESPDSFIHERVTSDDIARVVSRMTGIPVRVSYGANLRMKKDELTTALSLL